MLLAETSDTKLRITKYATLRRLILLLYDTQSCALVVFNPSKSFVKQHKTHKTFHSPIVLPYKCYTFLYVIKLSNTNVSVELLSRYISYDKLSQNSYGWCNHLCLSGGFVTTGNVYLNVFMLSYVCPWHACDVCDIGIQLWLYM